MLTFQFRILIATTLVKSAGHRTHSMMSPRASYQMCNRTQMVWEDAKQLALQWFINTHKYCWGPACNHRRYIWGKKMAWTLVQQDEEHYTSSTKKRDGHYLKALRRGDCRSAKRCNQEWQLIIKEGEEHKQRRQQEREYEKVRTVKHQQDCQKGLSIGL